MAYSHVDDMSVPKHRRRWIIADMLEKKLNKEFPGLYCNVAPDEKEGYYILKVVQRTMLGVNVTSGYCFESVENLYGFPDDLLRARLWLISL